MVRTKVYVEGGGRKALDRECRAAFRSFFDNAGIASANIAVEARGPRGEAYTAFRSDSDRSFRKILLVDSEGPVSSKTAWGHLQQSDGWTRPKGATDDQCHLMVEVMESWFLAYVEALAAYYGQGFRRQALPANPNVEQVLKQDVLSGLGRATRGTRKGRYDKRADSFGILARLDPAKVRKGSCHANRFVKSLL